MVKLRRITLLDGTKKLEVIPPSPEEIEEMQKLRKDSRKRRNERNKKNLNDKLKRDGFETEYQYRSELAKKKGFKNRNDEVAKKLGYENHKDYQRIKEWERGKCQPMWLNKDCTSYLGIYIAENILPDIFEKPEMMPNNNRGFDAICKKGYKVDVKSSTINVHIRGNKFLRFHIKENKTADYFLLIAFDNRTDLNMLNMWLVKKDERLRGRKFNEFNDYTISVNNNKLKYLDKYKLTEDKIIKAKEVCRKFKEEKLSIKEE